VPYAIDPLSTLNPFSRTAVHLTAFFNAQQLATGSGVIAQHSSGCYLITALHVLSGRDPETQQPLRTDGGIPNRLVVEGCQFRFEINLYSADNTPSETTRLFAVHPRGPRVDVSLMRITGDRGNLMPLDISFLTESLNAELKLYVSQTCYILGFPEGLIHKLRDGVVIPIWKTGHLASEPGFDFDDLPRLLIDATTRSGMSGAMVFVTKPPLSGFVGIYTGRYKQPMNEESSPDERDRRFTSELGWVFRSAVVHELITSLSGPPHG